MDVMRITSFWWAECTTPWSRCKVSSAFCERSYRHPPSWSHRRLKLASRQVERASINDNPVDINRDHWTPPTSTDGTHPRAARAFAASEILDPRPRTIDATINRLPPGTHGNYFVDCPIQRCNLQPVILAACSVLSGESSPPTILYPYASPRDCSSDKRAQPPAETVRIDGYCSLVTRFCSPDLGERFLDRTVNALSDRRAEKERRGLSASRSEAEQADKRKCSGKKSHSFAGDQRAFAKSRWLHSGSFRLRFTCLQSGPVFISWSFLCASCLRPSVFDGTFLRSGISFPGTPSSIFFVHFYCARVDLWIHKNSSVVGRILMLLHRSLLFDSKSMELIHQPSSTRKTPRFIGQRHLRVSD